ncbi:putative ribonuclease H-like domain-containing protein [Tanacetum coccineum]
MEAVSSPMASAAKLLVLTIVIINGDSPLPKRTVDGVEQTYPPTTAEENVDLKNVVPQGGLTCLFAKATPDEYNIWHKRLGHVNFKTMNKLGSAHRNEVAKRKNKTLIEAARTMLADSKLPTFWAEAVNTACYVQNRVLVIKPHNKTPYELFLGRKPALSFMRPFRCPVTILNTIDHLGKFDGKADEGFFVGYSTNSKAFRVFNSKTRIVEENLHVQFSENTSNIAGSGPNWLFDIDALTNSMNYKLVVAGNQSNGNAGTKACDDAGKARMETVPGKDYILLPMWPADLLFSQNSKESPDARFKPSGEEEKKDAEDLGNESGNQTEGKDSEVPSTEEPRTNQEKNDYINSTNNINTSSDGNSTNNVNVVSSTINTAGTKVNAVDPKTSIELPNDLNMPELEDILYSDDDEDVGAEVDMNNLDAFMPVNSIPTTRIHKDHLVDQIIRDLNSAPQTTRMTKNLTEHGLFISVQRRINHKDFQNCLFACFLSQEEPKKIEEEVYVCQPPRFEDPDFPDRVYKVEKALYGLHQALRAWYETLSTYLLENIIFGFTKKKLCTEFEKMMHKKFQISSMGELTFFLGLQVKQKEDGIFISQDKYVTDILKKFGFSDVKTANTPMETHKTLLKDVDGEDVDEHMYRSVIGSLMYLTSSRPDNNGIGVNAGNSKLMMLDINLLLLGKVNAARHNLLLLVIVDFLNAESEGFEQIVDFLNASSITYALTVNPTIYTSCIKQFLSSIKVKTVNGEQQLQALVDRKKIIITEATVRRDLHI